MSDLNNINSGDINDETDYEQVFRNWKENNELYTQLKDENKQEYWNRYVFTIWWNDGRGTSLPIDIKKIRDQYKGVEDDIDSFLPGIIKGLEEEGFTGEIEDIFLLDDTSKKALEVQSNVSNSSNQVENTIFSKTDKIEGINISNEELAEKVGDLFYDSLSLFISSLGEKVDNKDISKQLEEASNDIMNAWNICGPYVSDDFPEMKHTAEVKGLDIDREELVKGISNLVDSELSDFLEKFSLKIEKDGEADKGRGRIKLANELFACADKLKEASKIL